MHAYVLAKMVPRWHGALTIVKTLIARNESQEDRMKYVVIAARVLLGAGFLFFGLNILLHFLKQPPSEGDAATFGGILAKSHWMNVIGALQVIGGLLILVNRFVPLGLTLLAPVLVNILLFHLMLLGGTGIAPGLILSVLEVFLVFIYRQNFLPLLSMNPEADTGTVRV